MLLLTRYDSPLSASLGFMILLLRISG